MMRSISQLLEHSGHKQGQAERIGRRTGKTELVEDALAACRISVAVACHARFYVIVVDLGIEQRLDTRLESDCSRRSCQW